MRRGNTPSAIPCAHATSLYTRGEVIIQRYLDKQDYIDLYPSKFFYEAQSQFAIIDIWFIYLTYILLEIHAISIWNISTFNIKYLCCTIIAVDTHI